MSKIVLASLDDEENEDKIIRDGGGVRAKLTMLDDAGKLASMQRRKDAAYEAMCKRAREAWKAAHAYPVQQPKNPLTGAENYVGAGGKIERGK